MNCMRISFHRQPANWPDTFAISLNEFRANKFPLCQTNARSHAHTQQIHTHTGRLDICSLESCAMCIAEQKEKQSLDPLKTANSVLALG